MKLQARQDILPVGKLPEMRETYSRPEPALRDRPFGMPAICDPVRGPCDAVPARCPPGGFRPVTAAGM
jgi:hypothetical protein